MAFLTRDAILEAGDRKHVDVPVPEWGGEVRVAEMSAAQRLDYQERAQNASTIDRICFLLALCLVDERMAPLFPASDDLKGKSGPVLMRLFDHALNLNILTKESAEKIQGE